MEAKTVMQFLLLKRSKILWFCKTFINQFCLDLY